MLLLIWYDIRRLRCIKQNWWVKTRISLFEWRGCHRHKWSLFFREWLVVHFALPWQANSIIEGERRDLVLARVDLNFLLLLWLYDIENFYRWLTSFGIFCFLMLLLKLDSLNISLFESSYNRCWLFDLKVYALVLVLLLLLAFSLLFLYISNHKVLFCPKTFVIIYSFPTLDIITSFTFGAFTGFYYFSRWGYIVVLEENRLSSC